MQPDTRDRFAAAEDIRNGSKYMMKLKRTRLQTTVSYYVYKKTMCVHTWIPAPRSPSLGNGSLSIIRTGMPFFRSDRARTRPEGPAPTYKDYHLDRVDRILLQSLQ